MLDRFDLRLKSLPYWPFLRRSYWGYFFVAGVIRAGARGLNEIRAGLKMKKLSCGVISAGVKLGPA